MAESVIENSGRHFRFRVVSPENLALEEWRGIQELSRVAFAGTLGMDAEDLDEMVRWGDPETFRDARIDPAVDARERRIDPPGDHFSNPLVALAQEKDGQVVGYMYSVNVSSYPFRVADLVLLKRNYHWIREIAVDREYRRLGLATILSCLLLNRRSGAQPTATNVWTEARRLIDKLISPEIGFASRGYSTEAYQVGVSVHSQRLETNTGMLLKRLWQQPHVKAATDFAEAQQASK